MRPGADSATGSARPPEPDFLAAYDAEQRRCAEIAGMDREETARTIRFVNRGSGPGVVLWSDLDERSADAEIDAACARFAELGQEFEWKLHAHDGPADLAARLVARGFVAEPEEALVALDLAALPARLAAPVDADVRPVATPEDFGHLAAVNRDAFGGGQPWLVDELWAEQRAHPDSLRIYLAWCDGAPAAAGWSRLPSGRRFASLWGGGTRPAFRGRGLYAALVAVRAQEARARGHSHALVDAGPMSRPILARLGFRELVRMRPHTRRP